MRKISIIVISALLVALAFLTISFARTTGERARLQMRTYTRPFRTVALGDVISDNGQEIYNVFRQRNIEVYSRARSYGRHTTRRWA